MAIPRDERPLHDQIIEHDLVALTPEQAFKLLIIEVRGMREDLRAVRAAISPKPAANKRGR